ncbi:hypothetical protein FQR65_LT06257 [Abscondita terminalis]|nr:hypothetical protein FQR65_LT06257 [Abscondita terminalis]
MSFNYIESIEKLNTRNVYIKNKEHVNKIIQNIIADGKDKLQIISDFDRTLTKQHHNGKTPVSSFGVFSLCPSVSSTYLQKANDLSKKYYPFEIDMSKTVEEKSVMMEEWYRKLNLVIRGEKVPYEEIAQKALTEGPTLRDGAKQLFDDLQKANIPVLVSSAGLGDSILAILNHSNMFYPNVKIVSNFLCYDEEGTIQGFKNNPIIHVFNKNECAVTDTDYLNYIKDRKNVFLMGDSLGDRNMADRVQHQNILKIGFLYDSIEKCLPSFMDAFDIVIEDDQTMDVPNAILNHLLY